MDENGNDFHYRVVDCFKTKGWSVKISPYYVDLVTEKPREIDIIAQKKWPVVERFGRKRAAILIRLFIECKWILPTISLHFNFIENDKGLAESLARNNDILRKPAYPPLEDTSKEPPRIHHYLQQNEVAKNCACSSSKDIFFEAWDQVLHALIYFRNQPSQQNWAPVDDNFRNDVTHIIDYPIVVVSSFDTFFKRNWNSKISTPMKDNFLWSVEYSYTVTSHNQQQIQKRDNFFVDITSFPTLEDFLADLERTDIEICRDRVWYALSR